MVSADVDPSLCSGEPTRQRLDDGFSPPAQHRPGAADEAAEDVAGSAPAAETLTTKSLF